MILSARAIASEIADSDAGEFLPSHCVNFRAARIQAAMRITRFLPSSTTMSVAYSLFVRYNYIRLLISDFGNLRGGSMGRLLRSVIFLDFDCSLRHGTATGIIKIDSFDAVADLEGKYVPQRLSVT